MVALIDGDSIPYAVGWHLKDLKVEENEQKGEEALKLFMENLLNSSRCDKYLGYLGSSKCFRHELYPKYKQNRKPREAEDHYEEWKKFFRYLLQRDWHFQRVNIEADDAVNIASLNFEEDEYVICGNDKDLLQIPGKHYNFRKEEFFEVTLYESTQLFWKQMLVGDTADNIKGIEGIGPIKAEEIMDSEFDKPMELPAEIFRQYVLKYGVIKGAKLFYRNLKLFKLLDEDKSFVLTTPNKWEITLS